MKHFFFPPILFTLNAFFICFDNLNFHQYFSEKEHTDKKILDSALQKISENGVIELKIHFIYAGDYYKSNDSYYGARSFILNEMKKYKIQSVMMTMLHMHRKCLITKEKMEKYYNEEFEWDGKYSVNDDLESLFEDLRFGKQPDEKSVAAYFLPKLTKEELELVERRDTSYLQTLYAGRFGIKLDYPDVDETEMMLSESDSKYVRGFSQRRTFVIENSSENLSEKPSAKRRRTS